MTSSEQDTTHSPLLSSHLLSPGWTPLGPEVWLRVTSDQDFGEICLSLRALPLPLILLLGRGDDVHPGRQDDVLRPVDLVEVDAVGVDRVGVEVVRLRRGVLVSQCRTLELEESGRHKTPLLPWLW